MKHATVFDGTSNGEDEVCEYYTVDNCDGKLCFIVGERIVS